MTSSPVWATVADKRTPILPQCGGYLTSLVTFGGKQRVSGCSSTRVAPRYRYACVLIHARAHTHTHGRSPYGREAWRPCSKAVSRLARLARPGSPSLPHIPINAGRPSDRLRLGMTGLAASHSRSLNPAKEAREPALSALSALGKYMKLVLTPSASLPLPWTLSALSLPCPSPCRQSRDTSEHSRHSPRRNLQSGTLSRWAAGLLPTGWGHAVLASHTSAPLCWPSVARTSARGLGVPAHKRGAPVEEGRPTTRAHLQPPHTHTHTLTRSLVHPIYRRPPISKPLTPRERELQPA